MERNIKEILTEFRKSENERQKGTKFEQLMRLWLLTDPRFNMLQTVWMWNDFPARNEISSKGDIGIDLVARTEMGEYWAIQCKCYAEDAFIEKGDVDSFLSTSTKLFTCPYTKTKVGFSERLWIATNYKWSQNAEDVIKNQSIPFNRINLTDLQISPVDWGKLYEGMSGSDALVKERKTPMRHQLEAIAAAKRYFIEGHNERGKLVMACGTGKTFTSLRIVEELTNQNGLILFLVPSISLLGQTLNEWSFDARKTIKAICICSDATASKNRKANDDSDEMLQNAVDLAAPATTDPVKISKQLRQFESHDGLTVVFSTYQSIEAVKEAQDQVLMDTNNRYGVFDFIVCDEAHRTTGVKVQGQDESDFSKIHDKDFIQGNKRLYMTATPKVYSDSIKVKSVQEDFVLYSMDNREWYGEEFYHVGFSYAVDHQLLTDYKVFVLTISENDIPADLKKKIRNADNKELNYNDTAKLVGVVSGLSKIIKGDNGETWKIDPRLMHRALAFCSNIGNENKPGSSKNVAALLPQVSQSLINLAATKEEKEHLVSITSRHVDGSMSSMARAQELRWLADEPSYSNECRVITNVRCLSEGVDVPALDSVIFLTARNSQVDVVQSVGRVMRNFGKGTADEKKYGYIIIPVVIPADADPATVLDASDFKTVWSILNALRSHDDRFNAHVNKINLNRQKKDKIIIGGSGIGIGEKDPDAIEQQLNIRYGEIEDKIYAKLVEKVGDKLYWENWAKEMGKIARDFIARINELVQTGEYKADMDKFVKALRKNLNPTITENEATEMLVQHMITRPVFDALFKDYQFVENNSVSRSMERMLNRLHADAFEKDTEVLQKFYDSVRVNVEGIDNLQGKQTIIKNLYEKFFAGAFKTTVEKLGIVYTPVECVDFIIHSVDYILRKEFKTSLTAEGVHILDPFTGTGTFITRLLQSGLIDKEDLVRKYTSEIHCNEIVLLAYYIADVNIEAVFHELTKRDSYLPYDGICLTDTFQMGENDDPVLFPEILKENTEQVEALKKTNIRVIFGNPPYSVGQKAANDNAQNLSYPKLDTRIANTYTKECASTNLKSLYDTYIKAFRWSSDMVSRNNEGGIVAFISNGAWLDGNAQDELRKCWEKEFTSIYVLNLRGNCRTSGELRRKEGNGVFGLGSRTPISITFLVNNPSEKREKARIFYHDIGDYLSREQKLKMVTDFSSIENIEWKEITPNEKGDWINQRDGSFDSMIPLWPEKKFDLNAKSIFSTYLIGIGTNRDSWMCNYSASYLENNMKSMIAYYNQEIANAPQSEDDLTKDTTKISWTRALKRDVLKKIPHSYKVGSITKYSYRPFQTLHFYNDRSFIESPGLWYSLYPNIKDTNMQICVSGIGVTKDFSALITLGLTDLELIGKSQCFPLYWYEENKNFQASLFDEEITGKYIRHDGITDWILKEVRNRYSGTKMITKENIFYYVYGILHSPIYRERFADDLKKSLPRIPIVENIEDFMRFSKIGRELAELHLNYEDCPHCPDVRVIGDNCISDELAYDYYAVDKMRFGKTKDANGKTINDKSIVYYNSNISITNIPIEAYDYVVNGKPAIDWIMERYAITTDKASGITNNPNDWSREHGKPRYILDLLLSIIELSLRSNDLVSQLPKLEI